LNSSQKTLILWVLLILMFISIYYMIRDPHTGSQEVSFNEFVAKAGMTSAEGGSEIKDVTVRGLSIEGSYVDGNRFFTTGPVSEKLLDQLVASGATVKFESENENSFWQQLLISWLPMIFIFVIFFMFMRQLQSGGGKAMSFGKARARLINQSKKPITFKDVAGIDEAIEETREIVEFLKDTRRFTRLGGRIPKGVLMMGSPGTGKTLLARAIAGEAGVPFFSISGSDFVEMFVGVGASRVRDLFEQGKKNAPCLIFIDEIDAVGRHRGAGLGGGHDEREQTLNQLLVEMDGFEANEGVILVAATNRPDVLDPALLRPGRFDRRVVVPLPDVKGREEILKVHARRTLISDNMDLAVIARGTPGFSGADLENLVNEAALAAARRNADKVENIDFETAKDKVLLGSERKSLIISDHEKSITAYHEAGHAVVAKLLKETDPVHKVTIIPRGRALGVTQQLPTEDRYITSMKRMLDSIKILLGGRIAEELIFDDPTTGAANDLERTTQLAHKMVCEWGMSKELGLLTFGKNEEHIFLGREISRTANYSDKVAEKIDAETRRIVDDCYAEAKKILSDNIDILHAMAKYLLEYETLDAEEIETIMKGGSITREKPEPRLKSREALQRAAEEEKRNSEKPPSAVNPPSEEPSGA